LATIWGAPMFFVAKCDAGSRIEKKKFFDNLQTHDQRCPGRGDICIPAPILGGIGLPKTVSAEGMVCCETRTNSLGSSVNRNAWRKVGDDEDSLTSNQIDGGCNIERSPKMESPRSQSFVSGVLGNGHHCE
jgi:hypothetical protein